MSDFFPIFLLALALIGSAVAAMALGVMFKRPCLRGSCGGTVPGPEGNKLSCATCPHRKRSTTEAAQSLPNDTNVGSDRSARPRS